MWDRIKDQAKSLQQQSQGTRGSGGHGRPGAGSAGGSRAQLVNALKSQLTSLKAELKSGAYRDASMAMCALVAAADGSGAIYPVVYRRRAGRLEEVTLDPDPLLRYDTPAVRARLAELVQPG